MAFWTILDAGGEPVVLQVESADEPDPAAYGGTTAVSLASPVDPLVTVTWDGDGWVRDLAAAKTALSAAVKAKRDAVEWSGCATPHGPIDTDPDSQRKIGGGSTAALVLGAAFSKDWRMSDDTIVTLDNEQMIAVGLYVVAHVDACQQRKNALDAEIEAATTLAELDAIDIESGWPG